MATGISLAGSRSLLVKGRRLHCPTKEKVRSGADGLSVGPTLPLLIAGACFAYLAFQEQRKSPATSTSSTAHYSMTYKESVAKIRASAPRPLPGAELPAVGSLPLSKTVSEHLNRLPALPRVWATQALRLIHDMAPGALVTSIIRPFRRHFSLHELGRAIDIKFGGPLDEGQMRRVLSLVKGLEQAKLFNMIYFGQTPRGNTVVHVEVHDLTAAGTPNSDLFINNGRHDEWLR